MRSCDCALHCLFFVTLVIVFRRLHEAHLNKWASVRNIQKKLPEKRLNLLVLQLFCHYSTHDEYGIVKYEGPWCLIKKINPPPKNWKVLLWTTTKLEQIVASVYDTNEFCVNILKKSSPGRSETRPCFCNILPFSKGTLWSRGALPYPMQDIMRSQSSLSVELVSTNAGLKASSPWILWVMNELWWRKVWADSGYWKKRNTILTRVSWPRFRVR